ncbi:arginine--tRNA ligase [Kangiella sediminilitoris]|uniref:Arginine--tRNA ligase n=1 Tax=Kangiella sediminilitoris TaxID=1144748 RepID=A0A1B3BAP6_9GAMM|nr:arginine--tRNA ligase [Kangiella sediminilitoris]AOE49869.1 Arginine--tRNA ligase [Kangiella sediminilitoris]
MLTTIEQDLSQLFGQAFEANDLSFDFGGTVRCSRPELGDFQCNGAMAAAKQGAGNPFVTAEKVVASLPDNDIVKNIDVVRPGFINVFLHEDYLAEKLTTSSQDNTFGCHENLADTKVMIDFGGPNVAKSMHVGHLRTAIIGDSLQRIFRFKGYNVVSDAHLGDWGTQMGMLIEGLKKRQPDLPYFDKDFTGPYPEESPVTIQDLETIYPEESGLCKTDEEAAEKARQATLELQNGREGYRALWQHFVNVSIATLKRDYGELGVSFDLWKGESDADPFIPKILEELDEKGISIKDQGALIVPFVDDQGEKVMPPLILRKSDGAVMYGTTDLATLYERVYDDHAQIVLYVVDGRQQQHFKQVFAAADLMGMNEKTQYEHTYFGTVNGKDGKPFKTRSGGVMKLHDLIQMAKDEAHKKLAESNFGKDFEDEEKDEIAHKVAISTLKFADLRNFRIKDYIFDLEKFSEFEGKTGPYLLMQVARIKSILRKAADIDAVPGDLLSTSDNEKGLTFKLLEFNSALDKTIEKRAPHFLCEHLYNLAQEFSSFYQKQHILKEPDDAKRASLLQLSSICLKQLEMGLELLGIETLERM